jgi:hypothetical protein
MNLIFPKEIVILSNKLKIIQDKTHNGGSFDLRKCEIIIGTQCIKEDPNYVFSIISHEILKCIYCY